MSRKSLSGYTAKTAKNLVLDAGAFFKNFDIDTDTFTTAVTANKLIGATRGGGSFTAKPTMRTMEIDGVKGGAVGSTDIESWDVSLGANVLEITKENLVMALPGATVDSATNETYHIIKAKNGIEDTDYIGNITWVGTQSGNSEPLIIQVYNALSTEGLTFTTKDKDEVVISMSFKAHYDALDLDSPPFTIFYPKDEV